jgi:hypothetical protein
MNIPDRSEILAWAEEHGLKNLAEKIETATALDAKAFLVLTGIVAFMGTSLVFGAPVLEPGEAKPLAFGAAWLCGYVTLVGAAFTAKIIRTRDIPATYCEPSNLLEHLGKHSIDDIREGLFDDLQSRIDDADKRNGETARWINGALVALILSPLVFTFAALYRMP